VPAREPGEPLVVRRVFAPDGSTLSGVVVYAYNTDKDGTIRQTAKSAIRG